MVIAPTDVAVIGAGPAGLVTALCLAEFGFKTTLLGPDADPHDGRSAALFKASVELLKRLGAWDAVAPAAEPLNSIRLVDSTGALFRAPEVTFHAREIGQQAFGYNVPNAALTKALGARAAQRVNRIVTPAVTEIEIGADLVSLSTTTGASLTAPLIAAADGRASAGRRAAGIGTKAWAYEQAAIVCTFEHTRPHNRVSTEFHRRCGPLTIVPAPGGFASNLVWVDTPAEAERLMALSDTEFAAELAGHLSGLVGAVTLRAPRRKFPLSGQTADTMAKNRVALIGEAGHVMPPIGAQGLNLSFRDAAALAETAAAARDAGEDIGGASALSRYATLRHADVTSRVWTIDLLNYSLMSSFAPVHLLRGLGLFALSTVPPLRKKIMQEGIAPTQSTPKLMQPIDS